MLVSTRVRVSALQATVNGRILPDQSVSYGGPGGKPSAKTVRNGTWNMNDVSYLNPGQCLKWVCVNFGATSDRFPERVRENG
jgi:hypothetical protein